MSPKLSDSLRAMADRAPVGEASISAEAAIKRVKTRRAVRATGNSLIGAGAVTAIALAIVVPTIGAGTGGAGDTAAASLPETAAGGGLNGALPDDGRFAYGLCGGPVGTQAPDVPGTLTVLELGGREFDAGVSAAVDVNLTASDAVSGSLGTPSLLVVWDGIVVGSSVGVAAQDSVLELPAGESVTTPVDLQLVNCFDGSPLPGGTYQVVATQHLFSMSDTTRVPVENQDDVIAPAVEGDGSASNLPDAPDKVVSIVFSYQFVSQPVEITVLGETSDDPFGPYLNAVNPELPDGYLTPAKARELYQAGLVTGTWDMAKGTQRVLMTSDSAAANYSQYDVNYYGCGWDESQPKKFPTTSAQMDLLAVEGTLPSRISLSYGWIVDGNPLVDLGVKNVSEYVLPQIWEPNSTLVLVKDGVVVGEAYLTNLDRSGFNSDSGYFSQGDTLKGSYVWRDANGCWTANGPGELPAGTYTVLNSQFLYVSTESYVAVPYLDGAVSSYIEPMPREGSDASGNGASIAIDPGFTPGASMGEWVELHVWTSLGTVTIT